MRRKKQNEDKKDKTDYGKMKRSDD